MTRRKFNTAISFTDLLFNILQAFFILLLLVITVVNDPQKNNSNSEINLKAEYLITMEWPNGNKSDVDLFVQTPGKHIIFFGNKDVPGASLDRDDQGGINDRVKLDDGTFQEIEENWEHVTLRKAIKGEYVVNVLMFAKRSKEPVPVTVKVEKLNPYQMVWSGTIEIEKDKSEKTAIRFRIDQNGRVVERSTIQEGVANKVRMGP